jgi:signal transduction histidine kinase
MLKYWLIRTYDLQRDLPGHGHGGELRYGAGEQQAEGRASVTGAISTDFGMADYGFMTGPDEGDRGVETAGPGEARLLRELCHDLIELVASIKVLAHAGCAEAGPGEPVQDRLRLISQEAGRIASICGHVLGRPHRLEPVRLDVLAAEAAASARLRYSGGIDVVSDPVTAQVHPAVIVRILSNLLANACRAAGPCGQVRLVVRPEGDQALLTVADSGGGFGQSVAGRASLGLEIIGTLVLTCGGAVQMRVSELGGLGVTVTIPCAALPGMTAGERNRGLAVSSLPGHEDGNLVR